MLHEVVNVSTYTCVTLCFSFHQKTLLHVHGRVAKFQMKRSNLYGLFNVTMYSLGMGNKKLMAYFLPVNLHLLKYAVPCIENCLYI